MPQRHTRVLDVALVVASAPLWVPVGIALGVLVGVTSGWPVFFVQERIGAGEQPFRMIKFRTMKRGDNPLVPAPDRITPVGRFLRRSSLDELPQLLNVLRGEMSLVGPRPMVAQHHGKLNDAQRVRFATRPGMTGLAQVNGRNSLLWHERIELDVKWSRQPTTRRYLAILSKTAHVVVSGYGVDGHDPDDPMHRGDVVDLRNDSHSTAEGTAA